MHDGLHMHLLGCQERKTFRQVTAKLTAKDGERPSAGAVSLLCAVLEDVFHQVQVLCFH